GQSPGCKAHRLGYKMVWARRRRVEQTAYGTITCMKTIFAALLLGAVLSTVPMVPFAADAAPRPAARIAQDLCAGCHGPNLVGANAPNLLDSIWIHGGTDAD